MTTTILNGQAAKLISFQAALESLPVRGIS